jgi:hypothetical protein
MRAESLASSRNILVAATFEMSSSRICLRTTSLLNPARPSAIAIEILAEPPLPMGKSSR